MGSCLEAVGRFVGAVLAFLVLGFILSFLGCNESSGPWQPEPVYNDPPEPPVLLDAPLTVPTYDLPPPPDLDRELPQPEPLVEAAPIPVAPIPVVSDPP